MSDAERDVRERENRFDKEKFVRFAATRDPTLRDELITAHLGLAQHLARRFANRGEPVDDLVQVASIGVMKSVDRFDPERGVEFSTFAARTILGELKRHFRDKGWAVRAPRRIQELYLEIGHATGELAQKLGRPPTLAEIGAVTGATLEAVIEATEAGSGYRTASLDTPARLEKGGVDAIGQEDSSFGDVDNQALIGPAFATLPEREQTILRLRFVSGMTQSEIAGRIGVSQMHVSRLLTASLRKLREKIEAGSET
ncbi:MAG: SigB/SigF/SigG family RNA polymerase sigma factor [Acidimicrobiales bacterium]